MNKVGTQGLTSTPGLGYQVLSADLVATVSYNDSLSTGG